jgi:hypothetical protein
VKRVLGVVSVVGLVGASSFVTWSVLARPDDAALTSEQAHAFDFMEAPRSAPAVPAPAAAEDLRDAVAAPVSPRPIPLESMAVAAATQPEPAARRLVTPELETAARRSKFFTALLSAPVRFLAAGTALKSPRALRGFLADKDGVEAYMNSALVRVVLNSPAAAKSVLGSPILVRAFLATPALRDPAAVRELLGSRMLVKMLDCPGVQEALADPAVIRNMVADPATLEWLAENPAALKAVASAAPALGRSLGVVSGR